MEKKLQLDKLGQNVSLLFFARNIFQVSWLSQNYFKILHNIFFNVMLMCHRSTIEDMINKFEDFFKDIVNKDIKK